RQRHRHDSGAASQAVPRVYPGRLLDRAALRRHWPRIGDYAQACAHYGRRRYSDERARQGFGLYGGPAGRYAILTRNAGELFWLRNEPPNGADQRFDSRIFGITWRFG